MPLDLYITKNNKKLRLGYTTGTCAALAAKASCQMLLSQEKIQQISVITPKGIKVTVSVFDADFSLNEAVCCVIKDGGDDVDSTSGMRIYVKVIKTEKEIVIDGGEGIGRVTKKGLEQPVGSAAINLVPRKMIEEAVEETAFKYGYTEGFHITVFSPEGEERAKRTFNSQLGIIGGISIIGTSGIVEPMSLQAISDTIGVQMKMLLENGEDKLIVTPGNYGETFALNIDGLNGISQIKCSNFIGDTLDYALEQGFKKLLFIGHAGKFVKIAGGIMNTHSSFGDCRMEIITAHACFFSSEGSKEIMDCVTVDGAIEVLDRLGIRKTVFESITKKVEYHLNKRVYGMVETGAIIFSERYGLLSVGENGGRLLEEFGGKL